MVDIGQFYNGLAIVVFFIALGFLLSRLKILTDPGIKCITHLILSVALPIAFFRSFPSEFNSEDWHLFLWGAIAGGAILILLIAISWIFFNKRFVGKDAYEYKFAFVFNNTSFIGYPLVSATFGQDGLVAYAGSMLPWVLLVFTYGIWLFNRDYSWKDTLRTLINPNIIGIVLGAVFFIFSIQLWGTADRILSIAGGLTTPLSLFAIGFMLSQAKFKTLFKRWQVVAVTVLQLTVPATLTWLLLQAVGAPPVVVSVLTLMQMLPTAAMLGLLHQKYKTTDVVKMKNGQPTLESASPKGIESEAGEIVALSTLLSAITVPILILLLLS
ncbi:AEC family transporter [Candidatus Saccharibacteria bacterium]|nr:AEC family transporter [Candidatus Saccharibacteria bacterium]